MRVIGHKAPHFAICFKILSLSFPLKLQCLPQHSIPRNYVSSVSIYILFYVFRPFTSHFDVLLIIQSLPNPNRLILLKFKARFAKGVPSRCGMWYFNATAPMPLRTGRYLHGVIQTCAIDWRS